MQNKTISIVFIKILNNFLIFEQMSVKIFVKKLSTKALDNTMKKIC